MAEIGWRMERREVGGHHVTAVGRRNEVKYLLFECI